MPHVHISRVKLFCDMETGYMEAETHYSCMVTFRRLIAFPCLFSAFIDKLSGLDWKCGRVA
eukprot:scaffold46204_cov19-Tisochrysis_lutea.AAC.6